MISICIPIYNFDVTKLVQVIHSQGQQLSVPYEIVLIDDCSDLVFQNKNEVVCNAHRYIILEKNIGRSAIRNMFLKYAKHNYLLLLDCDGLIISNDFLEKYVACIMTGSPEIICGGREYDNTQVPRNKKLRWKYGVLKESLSLQTRLKSPNRSFMTNNFLINRAVLSSIKFDERLTGYGHEDTLYGYELQKANITIQHIYNPVLNGDVETNTIYLQKTETGLRNLLKILTYINYDPGFINNLKILTAWKKAQAWHVTGIIRAAFWLTGPFVRMLLAKGYVNLKMFDFYKLGYLVEINSRKTDAPKI